jgi:hypothetical protein
LIVATEEHEAVVALPLRQDIPSVEELVRQERVFVPHAHHVPRRAFAVNER